MLKKTVLFLFILILFQGCKDNDDFKKYTSGKSYFGTNNYTEYMVGNLPIIISVPHDGPLEPGSIPNRTCEGCNFGQDNFTLEIATGIREGIYEITGKYPHIILNRLHRTKLDANREIREATDGHHVAEKAWVDFHAFIEDAKAIVTKDFGKGFYIDLHGHTHEIQQIELGYLLDDDELQLDDETLNDPEYIEGSGLRSLANSNLGNRTHAELLRGEYSLGTLLAGYGIIAVPSAALPAPGDGDPYFSGGFNTREHGSRYGGTIDGVQIECQQELRHDETLRTAFINAMSEILVIYIQEHYVASIE